MKAIGTILLLIGLAGTVFFGIEAINNSETFSFLGVEVALSSANWTPVIISGAEYVKRTSCFNTCKASRLPRLF